MKISKDNLFLYSTCQFDTCTVCNDNQRAVCRAITYETMTFSSAAQTLQYLGWKPQSNNGVFFNKSQPTHKIYLFTRNKVLGVKSFTLGINFDYTVSTRKDLLKVLNTIKFN